MPCENKLQEGPTFTEKHIPDLDGYVAIVTGGNGGIGYETTKQLALRNARVYIASRSAERVTAAISQMTEECSERHLDVQFLQMDLMDLASVKVAAMEFMRTESRLDILINNAGVMAVPYKLTVDGFESQWQINYLAPFIFTTTLLPHMLSTASLSGRKDRVRVVNVASDLAHRAGPKTLQLDDVNMTKTSGIMEGMTRYGHSKQAAIRHAKELNDRYNAQGVTAYSLHPGIVKSNLQSGNPTLMGTMIRVGAKFGARTTPLEGSLNSLYCATSPTAPIRGQGRYFLPVANIDNKVDGWLEDSAMNERLWKQSEEVMMRYQ